VEAWAASGGARTNELVKVNAIAMIRTNQEVEDFPMLILLRK
jgi:hypothetical protein